MEGCRVRDFLIWALIILLVTIIFLAIIIFPWEFDSEPYIKVPVEVLIKEELGQYNPTTGEFEFINEVEKVLDVIEQQPASGPKITNTERRFLVSRFSYGIIYSVGDDLITIFAVMNLKRKPGYWKSRT